MEQLEELLGMRRGNRWDRVPSEVVEEGLKLEADLKPAYHAQRVATMEMNRRTEGDGQQPHALIGPLGRFDDRIGRELGVDVEAYRRAKHVYLAAQHDPERYGDLLRIMDQSRQTLPAYRLYLQRRDNTRPVDEEAIERLLDRLDWIADELPAVLRATDAARLDPAISKLRKLKKQLEQGAEK